MTHMLKLAVNAQLAFARLVHDDDGQGLTEYALIVALVALVAVVALHVLSSGVTRQMYTVGSAIKN